MKQGQYEWDETGTGLGPWNGIETGRDYGIETGRDWNRDKATGCEMEMITA